MSRTWVLTLFVATSIVSLNVGITLWRVGLAFGLSNVLDRGHTYTYTGQDFPPRHPSLPLRPASITLQESVHYGANGSDPITSQEWETLKAYPHGLGRTFLGSERREFLMSFYHQLHCVREIEMGLANRDDPDATPHHMKHCLDYLRQTILCSAIDTLEKGDFMTRNWETQRTGADLVCWDWEIIYKQLGDGWLDFTNWRDNAQDL